MRVKSFLLDWSGSGFERAACLGTCLKLSDFSAQRFQLVLKARLLLLKLTKAHREGRLFFLSSSHALDSLLHLASDLVDLVRELGYFELGVFLLV